MPMSGLSRILMHREVGHLDPCGEWQGIPSLRLQLPFALTISANTHTEEHAMRSGTRILNNIGSSVFPWLQL
jgi:hypothetical protein